RVRRQADVPRAAVLALAVAVEGEAVPERAAIGAAGGEDLVDDGDRVAHGRVVGRLDAEADELEEARVDDLALVDARGPAVADVVGRALVRLAILREPQVVRLGPVRPVVRGGPVVDALLPVVGGA